MKKDSELRHDVERELEWDPSIDERQIGVAVMDGVVTLAGEVSSYSERWRAERAAERVEGVRGIVNELEVHGSEVTLRGTVRSWQMRPQDVSHPRGVRRPRAVA